MQKFEYRTPRFPVDIPVRMTVQDFTLTGRCTDISEDGMKVEFRQPIPADVRGMLTVSLTDRTLEVNVRVAYMKATHDGLAFIYESDRERSMVTALIASLANRGYSGRPLRLI
jgi:hypothetical protein